MYKGAGLVPPSFPPEASITWPTDAHFASGDGKCLYA